MAEMQCPKCRARMETIERSGINLERCSECGGVFLDPGELERLEQAEAAAFSAGPASRDVRDPGSSSGTQSLIGDLMTMARDYKTRRTI